MKKEWILNDEQLKRRKNSRLNSLKSVGSVSSNDPVSPQQIQQCNRSNGPTLHSPLPPLPSLLTSRNQSIDENVVKREPIEQPMLNQLPTQHQILPQTPAFINPLQLNDNIRLLQEQNNNNNIALHQILNTATTQQQQQQNFIPLLSQYNRMPQMNSNEIIAQQQQLKSPVVEKVIKNLCFVFKKMFSQLNIRNSSQIFISKTCRLTLKCAPTYNKWQMYRLRKVVHLKLVFDFQSFIKNSNSVTIQQ